MRKNGNWTIKNREKRFESEVFKVYEDAVIKPDGSDGSYSTIEFKPGVAVLPIDDEGFVYLTRQFRYALERDNVEVICGAMDGESPLEAAKRESREELGIEAKEWIDLGKMQTDTSVSNSTSHLFIARGLSFTKPETDGSEEIEMIKMTLDEAREKVKTGEITNGQTRLLVLLADNFK